MMSSTLGAICDHSGGKVQTGPFGSQLHQSDYKKDGIPVVMPQDIVNDRISTNRVSYIDEVLANKLGRHLLAEGDIIFPRRGEISKRAIVDKNQVGFFCGTGCLKISIPPVEILPKWFFYYLGQAHILKWIEGKAVGATMLNLNTGILRSLPVEYPELNLQARIVEILSNYDDLIETNHRRITLLEESARLLYREWFVNLRFPGHELVKWQDGLPEGWRMCSVGEMTSFLSRGITPKYDDAAPGLVINQKCIRGGLLSLAAARRQSKEVKPERLLQVGDILINSTGTGTLGRVAQVRSEIPNCTADTHVTIVRPLDTECFGYFGVALLELEPLLSTMGVGATNQTELGRVNIAALSLIEPSPDIRKEFQAIIWPIFTQVETLAKTNNLLSAARDELLPKLMSGAIRV